MSKNRNGIHDFFSGRNGMDQLSWLLLYISIGIVILFFIFHIWALLVICAVVLSICIYRIFSRRLTQRNSENQAYLSLTSNIRDGVQKFYLRRKDKRTHKIYKCPNCSQKIRVPKGIGEIAIKCPSCRIEFRQNTGWTKEKP